jgi:S1-C subfamily serine protease
MKISLFSLFLAGLLALAGHPAAAQERMVPQSREQVTLSFAPVVRQVAPAVVNIYTKRKVLVRSPFEPLLNDPVFRQFFGNQIILQGAPRERIVSSLGSGVIVHPDGILITSSHVVSQSDQIIVVLNDKREFPAQLVADDPESDLAMLKIDTGGRKMPFLRMVESTTLEVGDMVLAVGNPFGVGQTVTSGIVSALARPANTLSPDLPQSEAFIQTDAAINPGNSGGALVNMQGELVGINTAIYSQSGGSVGIGFAIPSDSVKKMLRRMLG